ncbi:MAG: putative toxin-antitoxin system toxin component, PIN family [Roseofilum sp. SBFL]|uniref:putative toxin-antitoxin system toxin component, PIN family n=1 Tax=unclassified Roseofilum TaxID=2620099 RepID=UPI001B09DB77|nr:MULTISPECIES: putative toxin-antitoxin system toxin component, PIN family [unclassified Roseofilum]MBP0013735.1 putative toxin-antitoxin system toxin component, PIN family [Roseofilum sp. SID3]MBP0024127.1 putative toxin-antitoxin system toxin component, PIN family [Roseofilum sp. SID2]MBP0035509.1 putative toxin-antitoxin system toxin component, PIN family [Roseofilum sp. Belize BBD 4]MBP0037523.1 putative toxin-antitoxin system toxin component, PIN family [Roseofilum sp. SID1]MBP0042860.1
MTTNRIVIDTNVVVSALILTESTAMKAFQASKFQGIILISSDIILEISEVLSRPKFDRYISTKIREDFLASLYREAEVIEITETIDSCRDPKDNKFLEVAISGNASYITALRARE